MDVCHAVSPCHSQLFADDIAIDATGSSAADLNQKLSPAVSSVATELEHKGLILNAAKTQVMCISYGRQDPLRLSITCRNVPLTQTSTAKYLGLHLDDRLRFEKQLSLVIRRSAVKLNTLRTIRSCLSEAQAKLFYTALVASDVLYASNCYFPALRTQQQQQLAIMDKRFMRCITNTPAPASTAPMYNRLKLLPILDRAQCKLRVLAYRIHNRTISELLSNRVEHHLDHRLASRDDTSCHFVIPATRSRSGSSRPILNVAKLWNVLPLYFKRARSPAEFRRFIRTFFYNFLL